MEDGMAEAAKLYVIPGELGDRKVYVVRKGEVEPEDLASLEHHPALEISVARQDSVHWISYEQRFRVAKIQPLTSGPAHPFFRKFPEDNPEFAFQINSGPARQEAVGHVYRARFEFEDGCAADPHIRITA
jgi:hypothetical protein